MHKLIQKMKDQLAIEVKQAEEKLTNGNLNTIFQLTEAIKNLECMEKGEWEPAEKMAEEKENIIQKYSNGKYDKNIDALYASYIEAKEMYRKMKDQEHWDKLMNCVRYLIVEVHDMLYAMKMDSDFKEEKSEIMKYIRMLADE